MKRDHLFSRDPQLRTVRAEYDADLEQFPSGTFAPLARIKQKKLRQPGTVSAPPLPTVQPDRVPGNWNTTFGQMTITRSGE